MGAENGLSKKAYEKRMDFKETFIDSNAINAY